MPSHFLDYITTFIVFVSIVALVMASVIGQSLIDKISIKIAEADGRHPLISRIVKDGSSVSLKRLFMINLAIVLFIFVLILFNSLI
jgi:hypothetical protein